MVIKLYRMVWLMKLIQIQWGALPLVWYIVVIALCVVALWAYRMVRVRRTVNQLVSSGRMRTMLRNFSWTKIYLRLFLASVGLLFLLVGLLHPQIRARDEVVKQQGRDLLIALDVSRSMLAEDMAPNRLEAAKIKIEKLVRALSCERVGLILFSGSAIVQCPLTADHDAFFMFLHDVDAESIASGTTAMDQAIKKTLETFERVPERKHKMVVLFTDGEDFSSSLARIRDRAKQAGLTIFTVGVGSSEGSPIPLFTEQGKRDGYLKDAQGTVVMSRRNDGILYALAHETGGVYIPMSSDDTVVRTLVAQVQSREKELFGDKKIVQADELYPYCYAISLLCFALEWIV
jgi:Ca-activated chloride channel family protein